MLRFQPDDCKTLISDDLPMTYRRPPDDCSDDVLPLKGEYSGPVWAALKFPSGGAE